MTDRAVVLAITTIVMLSLASQGSAATARSDFASGAGRITVVSGATPTVDLKAYSDDGGVPLVTNGPPGGAASANTPTTSPVVGAAIMLGPPAPVISMAGRIFAGPVYSPVYGVLAFAKTMKDCFVRSSTAAGGSFGAADFLIAKPPPIGVNRNRLQANSTAVAPADAAAESDDPIPVVDGTYPYDPGIKYMRLETQPGEGAGVNIFAQDTRSSAPLFRLSITSETSLNSVADLNIDFEYDSSRLSLGSSTPGSIIQAVRNGFSVSPGIATFGTDSTGVDSTDTILFNGTLFVTGGNDSLTEGTITALNQSSVSAVPVTASRAIDRLSAWPSPSFSNLTLSINAPLQGAADVEIFNIDGRRVRSITMLDGASEAHWDGRDGAGQPVSSGVYLVRLVGAGVSRVTKVVIMR